MLLTLLCVSSTYCVTVNTKMPSKSETFIRYGATWPSDATELQVELECIKRKGKWTNTKGRQCGEGLYTHYRKSFSLLWPDDDHHRWSDLGLQRICENDINVFLGASDAGKTWLLSKFILTHWWSNPHKTLWMVSSTELRGAELRILGALKVLFNQARSKHPWLVGTYLESKHCFVTDEISEDEARTLTKGIVFIPCKSNNSWVGMGCFPTGQLVDTPTGQVPIETLKPGDDILGRFGPAKIRRCSTRTTDKIVRVFCSNGSFVDCTPEHPFLTESGWMRAIDMPISIQLKSLNDCLRNMQKPDAGKALSPKVLLGTMQTQVLGKALCWMRECFYSIRSACHILFSSLQLFVEMETTGNRKEVSGYSHSIRHSFGQSQSVNNGESQRTAKASSEYD